MSESNGTGPQTFTDTAGRTWTVSITVADLRAIREETGEQLGTLSIAELTKLVGDPERFVAVLYVLVKDQADKVPLTPEQFACGLGGDALESAAFAWWRAWASFCPSQTRRLVLGLASKAEAMTKEVVDRAMEKLAGLTSSDLHSPSPVPPASTPAPGPSGS